VNLSLALGPVRPDGRHELATIVQAISLADEVRLEPGGAQDEVVCPGVDGENLAAAALAAYREATGWTGPPVRVTIDKQVPVAAGMGGGSSDAAATLRLAAAAASDASPADLFALAAGLGSDVPALLEPGLVLASGAGEQVRRLDPLSPFGVLVLPSPHRLSTADVYREADRLGLPRSAADLEERRATLAAPQPMTTPFNDLEPAARSLCPSIDAALADARAAGATAALVSGSGPTVFGLFPTPDEARAAAEALADRHPGARAASPVGAEAGRVEAA
jgi:4-diphosphocytidyl-2-C-methyl-D-erythritol kinase